MKQVVLGLIVSAAVVGVGIGVYLAATRHPASPPPLAKKETPRQTPAIEKRLGTSSSPLIRVFGVVTDSSTGAPLDSAQIRVRKERRERGEDVPTPAEATTDMSGMYEVRVEPEMFDAIICSAPGYTRQRTALNTAGRPELRMDFVLVRGGTVSGRVTDKASGDPVEGIGIELVGAQENIFERMRGREFDPGRGARTQSDGSYALDGIPAGSYRVILGMRGTGYTYHPEDAVSLNIEAGKTYDNVNFAIERGAVITGTVRNKQSGDPIADTRVFAMPAQMIQQTMRRMNSGLTSDIGPDETHTDEHGEFVLNGLDFDSEYRVIARAQGMAVAATDIIRLERPKPAPHVDIALSRGSTVSGSARYPDGTAAAGTEVLLFPDAMALSVFMDVRGTRTGEDGSFSFENVAAGNYWVRPEGDFGGGGGLLGRPPNPESKPAKVEPDGINDITGVEIIVAKGTPKSAEEPAQGSIKGTIIGQDGKPAADVRVEARQVGNPGRSYGATSAADGTFELAELRGPLFNLTINADEGIAKQDAVPVGANVTLKLTPPASLSGHVVDGAGDPVPGCTVRLTNMDEAGKVSSFISIMQGILGAQPGGQSTDANGHFEFTKLAPGTYVVKAQSASRGTAETDPLAVAAGEDVTGVQITLSPGVTISGTVVGPSGELVRGATVQLGPVTQDTAANLVSTFVPTGVLKTAGTTTTNERGEFTLNQVAPGTYRLAASHSDYAKSIVNDFKVSAGQDIHGYRISLGRGGEARGTFTIDGKPQPGSMIVVLGEAGIEVVQTDSQGRFDVKGLTSGPHMIAAFDPSRFVSGGAGMQFSPQVVDINEGQATDISLGGTGGVKVSGTLSGGDLGTLTLVALRKPDGTSLSGMDLANFSNLLESMRSLGSQTMVGPDGSFSMDNVPPGNYTLEVYSMNFDESNHDINALLNLPRTPAYSKPIEIGAAPQPVQIDLSTP